MGAREGGIVSAAVGVPEGLSIVGMTLGAVEGPTVGASDKITRTGIKLGENDG